jgi:hypothetical protein
MTQILQSRSTTTDETMVYFVHRFNGEIRLSPDNRIRDPRKLGWNPAEWGMYEAKTAREKESISGRMAAQLYEKKKSMKVEQHMREQAKRNELRCSARLRLAQSPTQLDAMCNQKIIERIDADETQFFKDLAEEFTSAERTSGLEMEWAPQNTSYWGRRGEKQAGVNG